MTTTNSRLGQALGSSRLALTAECLPPLGDGAGAVKKLSSLLPAHLDAVVVADSPGGIHGSALACAAMLAGEGRPSVLSMVTRDRNRIALESDARGAAALGVEAIFCLSGDHQSLSVCPQAAGVYDIDSIQFTQALKGWMREGPLPELPIGAAAHPYQQPLELNLLRLRKKIAAGASFLLTQAIFDLAGFTKWMDAVRAAGLDQKVAIIASVLPLTSVELAKVLDRRRTYGPVPESVITRLSGAADAAKEGIEIAAEMAAQVKAIPGVRGIHVLCGGCESAAAIVIQKGGLA
ncbi:MAG: methylenetetrahydrofolate reductase [Bryobacteraceae bacterium]|jgi:methylenetetrahydrofolate reductase (NADPH)